MFRYGVSVDIVGSRVKVEICKDRDPKPDI